MQIDEITISLLVTLLLMYVKLLNDVSKIAKRLERIEERTIWLEKYIRNNVDRHHG
ncbi:MAG: hypothetical protein QXK71_07865 [Pyrobaculum sp.]